MATPAAVEAGLILRAQTGRDDQAFARLVQLYQGKVRSFLVRVCRQVSLADDLAQETFLIAYQKLHTFQGSGDFSAWLCSIAYRCFLQHYRKQKRQQEVYDHYTDTAEPQASYYEGVSPDMLALEKAMQSISEIEAAALTLCHSFGYSHGEAAKVLNLPLGTVKSHVNRGKQKLRELLMQESTTECARQTL